jgi:hypothetical protein
MTKIFMAALFLIPTWALADGEAAQFKGYTEINRVLKERVAKPGGFELGQYLGENSSEPSPAGLLSLLGTYLGGDTSAEFRNGDPNAMNMILWYIALSRFASDVGSRCGPTPTAGAPQLLPDFVTALTPICGWPAASAKTDQALYALWMSLLDFDAPDSEFQAWKDFVTTDPQIAQASGPQAAAALILAALYNPYFLLRD